MKSINVKPTAKVAIKRNVLKQYNVKGQETVFMADGTEFELELYNPLDETIMCKISYNGKKEDDGLVLYPGQRVFLERFLEDDRKFKFVTYNVEDKNPEVDNAIKQNGNIKVEFFKEYLINKSWTVSTPYFRGSVTYTSGSGYNHLLGAPVTTSSCYFSGTASSGVTTITNTQEDKKETGIIAKGEQSDQKFTNVQNDFQYWPFETVNIKILPDSQQVLTSDDIKHKKYCSQCGKKVNHNDKFCSDCGNKL